MSLTEEQLQELEQIDHPEAQAMAQRMREGLAYRAQREQELREAGEWDELIGFADSHNRAAVLVEALDHCASKTERTALLREWFNSCDAIGGQSGPLREHFQRAGFVTDIAADDTETPQLLLPTTVYRAQWGKDKPPVTALSWTLRREVAESFARYLTGPRAWYLGIRREDDEPWIWQARCTEAFGWITGRGEAEVIAKTLVDLLPISKLVEC